MMDEWDDDHDDVPLARLIDHSKPTEENVWDDDEDDEPLARLLGQSRATGATVWDDDHDDGPLARLLDPSKPTEETVWDDDKDDEPLSRLPGLSSATGTTVWDCNNDDEPLARLLYLRRPTWHAETIFTAVRPEESCTLPEDWLDPPMNADPLLSSTAVTEDHQSSDCMKILQSIMGETHTISDEESIDDSINLAKNQPGARDDDDQDSWHDEDVLLADIDDAESDKSMDGSGRLSDGPSRKRRVRSKLWRRNQLKSKKDLGLSYRSAHNGVQRPAKKIGSPCKSSCKLDCDRKFSLESRKLIFDQYWGCGNYERQRNYIAANVIPRETKATHRIHRQYYLNSDQKKREQVCKKFFLNTLGVKEKTVTYTLKKKGKNTLMQNDLRGRHTKRKTPGDILQGVKGHISMFPCVESHYCRQSTKRKYLDSSLSVRKMYDLYKGECCEQNQKFASIHVYRHIFNTEFNLGFHKPKKDQCSTCAAFNAQPKEVQNQTQSKQDEHIQRKDRCREEKANDKSKSQKDPTFSSFTFDLQQVLQTPCGQVSTLYYKRKFSSYNLTIYDQATHDGTCYFWNEDMGNRGSTEIGTCLLKHIWSLPESVKHISLFSDCCGGQNRNQYVAGALSYAVKTVPNLCIIDQKFLESGHTQMEVDSMHSSIEYAKKNVPVYHPDNWIPVLSMARRKQPYKVVQLSYDDFIDLHHLSEVQFSNVKKDTEGNQVNWLKIKMLRFEKQQPNAMFFKYNFDDDFRTIKVSVSGRRKSVETLIREKKAAYGAVLPVSEAKKKDLLSLCESGIIPKRNHSFYKELVVDKKKSDTEE